MTCCCKVTTPKNTRRKCPECGQACMPVSMHTLLHQVQFPKNLNIPEGEYGYCPDSDCSMGYFSVSHIIQKKEMRVSNQGQEALVCYCFDVPKSTYQAAIESGTAKSIKDFVVPQTKSGVCACDSRNPSGRCCLADFSNLKPKRA